MSQNKIVQRCAWVTSNECYINYHDHEWGIPNFDPHDLFTMLCLEGAQAGLSWWTILQKREAYYEAFDQFDCEKMANYDEHKIIQLLQNENIVRNKLKIHAFISNAQAWINLSERIDPVDFIWDVVGHKPVINHWTDISLVPSVTEQSITLSKKLKKEGFKFVGPTIAYAYMQAVGMVNDHITSCFCHPDNH